MAVAAEPRPGPSLTPILWVVFISTLGYSVVLPFLVFLVLDFGGNAFAYGLVGATYSACQLVGAPVLGRLSDRLGRRRVLLLTQSGTLAGWCLFLVALAVPVSTLGVVDAPVLGRFLVTVPLVLVFLARAIDGLSGGNVSVANAYVADVTGDDARSASFGRMAVAQNLGFVIGPAMAGVLGAGAWGAAGPVVAALAISVAGLVLIATRLPESQPCAWIDQPQRASVGKVLGQEQRDCHEVQGARRAPLRVLLRLPGVVLLLAMHFLIYLAFNLFYVALPVHTATRLGWSMGGVGLFLSFLSALMVLVQGPVLSAASRRVSDAALVLAGGLVLACSFLLFASSSVWVLAGGAALLALGNGLMWPSLLALLSKSAGAAAQGAVQGIAGGSSAVASMLGLLAGGMLYRVLEERVFVWAAAIAVIAWAAAWRLPVSSPTARSSGSQ